MCCQCLDLYHRQWRGRVGYNLNPSVALKVIRYPANIDLSVLERTGSYDRFKEELHPLGEQLEASWHILMALDAYIQRTE